MLLGRFRPPLSPEALFHGISHELRHHKPRQLGKCQTPPHSSGLLKLMVIRLSHLRHRGHIHFSPLGLGTQPCGRQMTVIPAMIARPATQSKRKYATDHKVTQLSTKDAQPSSPPAERTPALSVSARMSNNDVDISVLTSPSFSPQEPTSKT